MNKDTLIGAIAEKSGLTRKDSEKALNAFIESVSEALARKGKRSATRGKKTIVTDPYLQSLEDQLKRSLGTKVEIRKRGGRGQIMVHFYSDDELDRLMEFFS